jgi:hypothetical protein
MYTYSFKNRGRCYDFFLFRQIIDKNWRFLSEKGIVRFVFKKNAIFPPKMGKPPPPKNGDHNIEPRSQSYKFWINSYNASVVVG